MTAFSSAPRVSVQRVHPSRSKKNSLPVGFFPISTRETTTVRSCHQSRVDYCLFVKIGKQLSRRAVAAAAPPRCISYTGTARCAPLMHSLRGLHARGCFSDLRQHFCASSSTFKISQRHTRMPSKRVVPQSSDSDAPIVVTPRKNSSSLSSLLAQDVLLSRPSSKQAPRAAASGGALSPATPSHAAKLASPAAAPPKLAKFAAAAARRRAANPRTAAASVTVPSTAGPLKEISPDSFYGAKDPEWNKRCDKESAPHATRMRLAHAAAY